MSSVIPNKTRVRVQNPKGEWVEGTIKGSIGGYHGIIYKIELDSGLTMPVKEDEMEVI